MALDGDTSNPFWEPGESAGENPFDTQPDESIESLLVSSGQQTPVPGDTNSVPTGESEEKTPTWDQIAVFLLRKSLHLTALELHTELYERGIQLPRLRDFFSNPGNFESVRDIQAGDSDVLGERLRRASSSQTLDSIDFARDPSEDDPTGRADERVAVLEFELRKAKDVIQSLREHLTNLTGSPEHSAEPPVNHATSAQQNSLPRTLSIGSQSTESVMPAQPLEKRALNFLINEYLLINDYKLTSITFTDECQDLDFDDWDDVGLNIAKPPGLVSLYRCRYGTKSLSESTTSPQLGSPTTRVEKCEASSQTLSGSVPSVSSHSTSPIPVSQHELIINDLRRENGRLMEDIRALKQRCEAVETGIRAVLPAKAPVLSNATNTVSTVSLISGDSFASGDSALPDAKPSSQPPIHLGPLSPGHPRTCLVKFGDALKRLVFPTTPDSDPDHRRMLATISRITLRKDNLISLLAESLPLIIPNVLLSKRHEVIPLLLITILLHEDYDVREQLLHQLFNLLKKPEELQRQMILSGCERYAALAAPDRLEGELLPQCWTQISHKYTERRILVAESCAVLAPFASPGLSGSLIISMLKQMLTEDKHPEVRERVLYSLAIVCLFVDDPDKLYQLTDMLKIAMSDAAESVVHIAINVYLPAVAAWTQCHSSLGPRLIEPVFLVRLESDNEAVVAVTVRGLTKLVPHIFADVIKTGPWKEVELDSVDETFSELIRKRLPTSSDPLDSLVNLIGDDFVAQCVKFFSYLDREWYQEWPQLKWVISTFIPRLCQYSASLHVANYSSVIMVVDLFKHFISYFGDNFATSYVSRCMKGKIQELGSNFLSHAIFVCFACAVVALCEPAQLHEFLSSALVSISDQSLPLDGLQLIFKDLSDRFPEDLTQVCWTGIVHHSVPVRLNAARLLHSLTGLFSRSQNHLEALIAPLITMQSDHEPRIRLEIIPSLAALLAANIQQEKLLTVFQGFLDDREHLDIVDESVRALAKCASLMDKKFHQEFLLPRLAVLVAQNPRLHVYRKDMAVCLLDAYVTLSCSGMGEEPWLLAPVMQSLRSLLHEFKELNMQEYIDIGQELSEKLARASAGVTGNSDETKTKVSTKIKDSGLTTMFKKK